MRAVVVDSCAPFVATRILRSMAAQYLLREEYFRTNLATGRNQILFIIHNGVCDLVLADGPVRADRREACVVSIDEPLVEDFVDEAWIRIRLNCALPLLHRGHRRRSL